MLFNQAVWANPKFSKIDASLLALGTWALVVLRP